MHNLKEIKENERAAIEILGWSIDKVVSSSHQDIKQALAQHYLKKKEEILTSELTEPNKLEEIHILSGFFLQPAPLQPVVNIEDDVSSHMDTKHQDEQTVVEEKERTKANCSSAKKEKEQEEEEHLSLNISEEEQLGGDKGEEKLQIQQETKNQEININSEERDKNEGKHDFDQEEQKCIQFSRQFAELLRRRLDHEVTLASLSTSESANQGSSGNSSSTSEIFTFDKNLLQQSLEQTNNCIHSAIHQINAYALHLSSTIQLKKKILLLQECPMPNLFSDAATTTTEKTEKTTTIMKHNDTIREQKTKDLKLTQIKNHIIQLENCIQILQKILIVAT